MCVLVAYSPTLYRMFCAATGFACTTQRVAADTAEISKQTITVAFDTNVAPGLPWRLVLDQGAVTGNIPASRKLVYFTAENLSDQAIVGHATFNVTPLRSGIYIIQQDPVLLFHRGAARCAREGQHAGGVLRRSSVWQGRRHARHRPCSRRRKILPLARPIRTKRQGPLPLFGLETRPTGRDGRDLFNEQCTACHALDANKYGPKLGGVFGRRAGTTPGYSYSAALKDAGLTWSADSLNRWLAGPTQFIAGVKMPVSVPDPDRAPRHRRLPAAGECAASQRAYSQGGGTRDGLLNVIKGDDRPSHGIPRAKNFRSREFHFGSFCLTLPMSRHGSSGETVFSD